MTETRPLSREDIWRQLGRMRVRFWVCPDGHSSRSGTVTVQWVDDIAYCTLDGCERTSFDTERAQEMPGGRHCRLLSVHGPHRVTIRRGTLMRRYTCAGQAHDHTTRCCTYHRHHTSPHVGCVLR